MTRLPASIFLCLLLTLLQTTLCAQPRQEEMLARMRLQLALSRFQTEEFDYQCWTRDFLGDRMLRGHLRLPEGVDPDGSDEEISTTLMEEVRFAGRARLHYRRPSWISWERRYYPDGGLLLARSCLGRIRGIHASFLRGVPQVRPEARLSCEELLHEERPCWLFHQVFPGSGEAAGWQEDFLVEREGSRLLRWRRFDGKGRMRECRIYLPPKDGAQIPAQSLPPLDLTLEAADYAEFQEAFLRIQNEEARDFAFSSQKIPSLTALLKATFSPRNLRALATSPLQILLVLGAGAATAAGAVVQVSDARNASRGKARNHGGE